MRFSSFELFLLKRNNLTLFPPHISQNRIDSSIWSNRNFQCEPISRIWRNEIVQVVNIADLRGKTPLSNAFNGLCVVRCRSVIILVINKLDSHFAVVQFRNHSYDYRPNRTPLRPITIIDKDTCMVEFRALS